MRIGSVILIIWLVIGLIAAAQRNYFNEKVSCANAGTVIVTIIAGPLNYVGVNPKLSCHSKAEKRNKRLIIPNGFALSPSASFTRRRAKANRVPRPGPLLPGRGEACRAPGAQRRPSFRRSGRQSPPDGNVNGRHSATVSPARLVNKGRFSPV